MFASCNSLIIWHTPSFSRITASEMSEFKDKVVIVTGASSGVGRATAILFAEHGARVVIVGRDHARLAETQKLCEAVTKREHIHQVHADVVKLEDLHKIVDETLKAFGQIDVLVNNAGAGTLPSISTITNEVFEEMINLNARAPLFLTQYCAPHLEKTKGSIVNVSTVGCLVGQPAFIGYTMAKAALDQLTRSSCAELGPKGITVNGVNPGLIATNFANAAGLPQEHFNAFESMIIKRAPAGRAGEPREIAEVIAFLASKKTYVHGVNLLADGGVASVMM